jgi:hypothetical protein
VDVFIVDAASYDEVQQQLLKFKDNIKIVNTFQPQSPAGIQLGTSNGRMDGTEHSTGTSTPPQQQQQVSAPPAVSVVTFRWDDDIERCENTRAR